MIFIKQMNQNNIGKYIRNAVILTALLCLFTFALAFWGIADDPDGTLDAAPGMDTISSPIELFTGMAFLIFTCVMLASFIVSAYKNKTMNLMFTYPVKRQKILASQMAAVWIFNFVALVLSKFVIYLFIFIGSKYMRSSFVIDFDIGSLSFYIQLFLKSFVIVSMSFIALFVGMALKSSKAAIITSFLLIFLTQANVGDFTMADNAVFPFVLTAVSFGFAVLSIHNVENKDI
ncbi:ABC transporter permease [Lachnospiraceae bacterium]|nr:ABC transporter permease [Ruminococcus sp.]NBI56591.1 ABC transporter permease [Lachnospiraceae bacterium]